LFAYNLTLISVTDLGVVVDNEEKKVYLWRFVGITEILIVKDEIACCIHLPTVKKKKNWKIL